MKVSKIEDLSLLGMAEPLGLIDSRPVRMIKTASQMSLTANKI